ncbi:hypothetical protein B0I08_106226 [Glaciihabitans tibetensis]|uniref:Acetyltransferase (GNAT) family protein n=1 Tax=Glaciihabitans tibetensis TaxID=1266600 RepID=A0A2T0VBQ6_9MICO|nr:GNAT family N-acetyltransferase [Glaciihabitans tibetensis]PRY67619.1 hypothetical protein B0I08_106226 [Glaciihabitans tibetensis]
MVAPSAAVPPTAHRASVPRGGVPVPTARLRFRRMSGADLDAMAALLGDPAVMAFYPAPKTRMKL